MHHVYRCVHIVLWNIFVTKVGAIYSPRSRRDSRSATILTKFIIVYVLESKIHIYNILEQTSIYRYILICVTFFYVYCLRIGAYSLILVLFIGYKGYKCHGYT